jgi:putative endonuclease
MSKSLGSYGEDVAVSYLLDQGFEIIDRNISVARLFEIDILALKPPYLVIVEVKTRSSDSFGGGVSAINYRKKVIMLRSIPWIRNRYKQYQGYHIRFDAVIILIKGEDNFINYYPDCIEYNG